MKIRRKQYLVDKRLQFKYLYYFVGSVVLTSITVSLVTYFTTWSSVIKEFSEVKLHQDLTTIVRMREYEGVRTKTVVETIPILKEEAKMLSHHQLKVIDNILTKTNFRVAVSVLIVMLCFAILSVFITHRIAGPIYRINRELEKLINGQPDVNFRLRKKDELQSLSEKLQFLSDKIKHDKERINLMVKKLESTNLTEEQKTIIDEIKQVL